MLQRIKSQGQPHHFSDRIRRRARSSNRHCNQKTIEAQPAEASRSRAPPKRPRLPASKAKLAAGLKAHAASAP